MAILTWRFIVSKFRVFEKIYRRLYPIKYWKSKGLKIGNNCEIYGTAIFGSEPYLISIGDNVRINSKVEFVTHDGGVWVIRNLYDNLRDIDLFGAITVGNNVHIGSNTIVMPGAKIGNNCIIGCGAIVTGCIPDNSIAVGVPARVIENIDEYVDKHKNDFVMTKDMSPSEKRKYLLSSKERNE